MDSKKRKYEFETKVRVPDMDEICKAAGQFADPPEQKAPTYIPGVRRSIPGAKEAAEKTSIYKQLMQEDLSEIKNEMEELANEVAIDEKNREEEARKAAEEAKRIAQEAKTAESEADVDPDNVTEVSTDDSAEADVELKKNADAKPSTKNSKDKNSKK